MTSIRKLSPAEADVFRCLRLHALQESPEAFASSYEEECSFPTETIAARLEPSADAWVLGAFESEELVGVLGFYREHHLKMRHIGVLWGMYVHPRVRGRGIAGGLLAGAVALARGTPGLQMLRLTVNAEQASARRLYASHGFRQVGVLPRSLCIDGRYFDEIVLIRDITE